MFLPRVVQRTLTLGLLIAVLETAGALPAAEPPVRPRRSDVQRVLNATRSARPDASSLRPLTVVLVADRKDHGKHEHDYPRWQTRWALLLGGENASSEKAANLFGPDIPHPNVCEGATGVHVVLAKGWPNPGQWETADLVVAYCYLPWNAVRLAAAAKFLARGGGIVVIHSATWTQPQPSPEVAEILGVGGFRQWRHGPIKLQIMQADHPLCRGLPANIHWLDEPYWPPTPTIHPRKVVSLAGSLEQVGSGQDNVSLQPQFWTFQHGKGRAFGCVPGHYTWTFDDPYFRILLLRGMAWAAGENPYRFDQLVLRSASLSDELERRPLSGNPFRQPTLFF